MNILNDVVTYIRRIIKSPSDAVISDNLIIDYINRFWMMDVDARIQLFDLKTKYQFMTAPGVDQYNMPLYNIQAQPGGNASFYPVYQGFTGSAFVNGVPVSFQTERSVFFNYWMNIVQSTQALVSGDGTAGPYTITMPVTPNTSTNINPPYSALLRGNVDIAGIIATGTNTDPPIGTTLNTNIPSTSILPQVYITTIGSTGNNIVVSDSGQFLSSNSNYGMLMQQGTAPFGYSTMPGGYRTTLNTVNYLTGTATVTFNEVIPSGNNINAQCYFFQCGLPRSILYYNNTLTLRSPPAKQYLVELDAYLSPAAFLTSTAALPYAYMAEYIARGAARKILSDTGDVEQFQFYEPLFIEQERLVWKRSQRQVTATRVPTMYSGGRGSGIGNSNFGGGVI